MAAANPVLQEISPNTTLVGILRWPVKALALARDAERRLRGARAGLGVRRASDPAGAPRRRGARASLRWVRRRERDDPAQARRSPRSARPTSRSVNTLVVRDGRVEGRSTDAAILRRTRARRALSWSVAAAPRTAFVQALPHARRFARRGDVAARRRGRRPRRERHVGARRRSSSSSRRARRSSTCRTRTTATRRRGRGMPARRSIGGLEVLVAQGRVAFELWTGMPAPVERDAGRTRLARVTLELATAGESHGPALVAILTGLPAGLRLDARRDRRRPRRRRQGYGRSPRQKLEAGRGRGARRPAARRHARHAARARRPEPRPRELDVGDEPVAARGRAVGQGNAAR